ncbi:DUF4845 domain-containing protein [Cellvibrio sp. ARAG 10.3]|uniref:DUF4845 domain-containing protein n=1 Tax=Cellvibrio sp. ARAG 10.3 TaxID=3451358 RepID=UPI002CE745AF|nr:DUF4845 domain-containing protein [Cellvibrio sp.]
MRTLKKQQGLGMLAWLVVLAIAGFFLLCAFKIIPLYAENRYVISGLKALVEPGTKLEDMTTAEIKKKMGNFYMINNVRSKDAQNIVVDRDARRVVVKIDYEARVNLFYNLDVVVDFKNHLDSTAPHQCCKPVTE